MLCPLQSDMLSQLQAKLDKVTHEVKASRQQSQNAKTYIEQYSELLLFLFVAFVNCWIVFVI